MHLYKLPLPSLRAYLCSPFSSGFKTVSAASTIETPWPGGKLADALLGSTIELTVPFRRLTRTSTAPDGCGTGASRSTARIISNDESLVGITTGLIVSTDPAEMRPTKGELRLSGAGIEGGAQAGRSSKPKSETPNIRVFQKMTISTNSGISQSVEDQRAAPMEISRGFSCRKNHSALRG
jgi:hypothetical protein